jgi:hypothetical protein
MEAMGDSAVLEEANALNGESSPGCALDANAANPPVPEKLLPKIEPDPKEKVGTDLPDPKAGVSGFGSGKLAKLLV